ncbi:MAG: glycosyltransferase [Candidatus Lokiarchaeota archaeon]|nr:glycosyltransferase [Candidatus Lokiarchaeota archaeon]
MNILIITDKKDSAIDKLAQMIEKYNQHLNIDVISVHPKRPDATQLKQFEILIAKADVVDFHYWKTAEKLKELYPEIKDKPSLLCHFNPYNLEEKDWKDYNVIVAPNSEMQKNLEEFTKRKIQKIHIAVDLDFFTWGDDYTEEKSVLMVAQRIEGKKGVLEVAQACKELGYKFILTGKISKPEYFYEIMETNSETEWHEWVTNEELRKLYQTSALHICNSVDNFESGTMPILEAMSCGCPVLSRKIGHVPDLYNGNESNPNIYVNEAQHNDIGRLKAQIKSIMDNREDRLKVRDRAWKTIRNFSAMRMAKNYAKLYNKIVFNKKGFPERPLVSVIIPATYDREEQIEKIVTAFDNQTYKNIELIIVWDEHYPKEDYEYKTNISVKQIITEKEGYNLAMARNLGVIEAEGRILVFCDSRLCPEEDAVAIFVRKLMHLSVIDLDKKWLYGMKKSKGSEVWKDTGFVENWSCLFKEDLVRAGMFNERIDEYGGATQELKTRFFAQNFELVNCEARVTEIKSAGKKNADKRNAISRMKELLWKLNN